MVRGPGLGEEESGRPEAPCRGSNRQPDKVVLPPFTEEFVDKSRVGALCFGLGNIAGNF